MRDTSPLRPDRASPADGTRPRPAAEVLVMARDARRGAAMPPELADTPAPADTPLTGPLTGPATPPAPRRGWGRLAATVATLAALWGGLTGFDAGSLVFGVPAVAAATALAFSFAPAPAWRLSPLGALRFAGWFALASVRGAVDVAGRALAWRVRVAPGFRTYETTLPEGPARLVFVNAITLLPGTLSAQLAGARVEVHMLDAQADLDADLAPLQARVRDLFALPPKTPNPETHR